MQSSTLDNQGLKLTDLEVKIEKYPMADSPNLLENFMIIGYEEIYFQEIILKNLTTINQEIEKIEVKTKKSSDIKLYYKEYKCRNLPTILGSISSSFTGGIFDGNEIIEKVFPFPPCVYYGYIDSFPHEPTNVVFTNIQNNVVNIGYGFIFYDCKTVNKLKIFIPKAFVIISQHPFFNIFNHLCKEIKKLYNNDQLQIPIEILLFNIVNFVPAPVNSCMKMTLIPGDELFEINRCKNEEEFFNLQKQEKYYLDQLSGYRFSDVNFNELFSILSVEIIVEVYLELLSGKVIGFFSKHIEILNLTMYIFQQFFFPIAPNENVAGLSPQKFFCSEIVDQYIVGFVCGYDDLDNYNPFRELKTGEFRWLSEEEEQKNLGLNLFKCVYILDLDKKIFKEQDKYDYCDENEDNNKQNQKLNEYFKKVIGGSTSNSFLDISISKLIQRLKEISYKLTSYQNNNSLLPKFFKEDSNNLLNRAILNAFYQFNLNISFMYYSKVSTYNGDYRISKEDQDLKIKSKEDCGLNDDEYLFFYSFSNSLYCDVLGNFIGGYSPNEPIIYKTPKRIFEKLLTLKRVFINKDEYFQNILDIYDSVYINKDQKNVDEKTSDKNEKNKKKNEKAKKYDNRRPRIEINIEPESNALKNEEKNKYKTIITFWEFYKYYFTSDEIAKYFYSVVSPEFVSGKVNKNNRINIKYMYKYKKIDIDNNLLLKYIARIKRMDLNTKKKIFKYYQDDIKMEQIITSNFISTHIEQYYINNKLIDYKELIRFSILCIVALSTSRYTLYHFTPQIYEIIKCLQFSLPKFVEILLSISLRLFSKEKDKNIYIHQKYFNIYYEGIVKRHIFPNDELIILKKKIDEFSNEKYRKGIIESIEVDMIKSIDIYKLDYDKDKAYEIKAPSYSFGTNEINKVKINFYSKVKNIKESFDSSYSLIKIYETITNILNEYYKDLDYSKIDKKEYNKIIIYLMYFTTIFNDDFPKDINLFLFYCLD